MSEPAAQAPRDTVREGYEGRLAARRADATAARRSAARISHARLAVFGLGLALAGIAFGTGRLDPRWLLAPGVGFIALVIAHDRVLRLADAREHSVRYYEDGIARLDASFAGRGAAGERFRDPEHLYADDLDLFGAGGLFELLCRARTAAGEAMLAAWLLSPAPSEEARGRQAAVRELCPALDLRESLALVGEAVASGLHSEALQRWGESGPPAPSTALRGVAAALSLRLGVARRRHARGRAAPDPVARGARCGSHLGERDPGARAPHAGRDGSPRARARAAGAAARPCWRVSASARRAWLRCARRSRRTARPPRARSRACDDSSISSTPGATSSSPRSAPRSCSRRRSRSRSTPGARAADPRCARGSAPPPSWRRSRRSRPMPTSTRTTRSPSSPTDRPASRPKRSAIRCSRNPAACATTSRSATRRACCW